MVPAHRRGSRSGDTDRVRFRYPVKRSSRRGPRRAGFPAQPARVALAGSFTQEGALQKLRLDKLDGTHRGQPFRLINPATATIGPNRYEVRNLLLASREGRIALDAGLVRNTLEGTATLTQVPLALASLASPGLEVWTDSWMATRPSPAPSPIHAPTST